MIKAKDIEGFLPEYRDNHEDMVGFNAIIKTIGTRRLTLDKERLAERLFSISRNILINLSPKSENVLMKDGRRLMPVWEEADEGHKNNFRQQADIIIADPSIIVCGEE